MTLGKLSKGVQIEDILCRATSEEEITATVGPPAVERLDNVGHGRHAAPASHADDLHRGIFGEPEFAKRPGEPHAVSAFQTMQVSGGNTTRHEPNEQLNFLILKDRTADGVGPEDIAFRRRRYDLHVLTGPVSYFRWIDERKAQLL